MPLPKAPNEPRGATLTMVHPTQTGSRKTTADKHLLAFSKHKSDHMIGIGICTDVKKPRICDETSHYPQSDDPIHRHHL